MPWGSAFTSPNLGKIGHRDDSICTECGKYEGLQNILLHFSEYAFAQGCLPSTFRAAGRPHMSIADLLPRCRSGARRITFPLLLNSSVRLVSVIVRDFLFADLSLSFMLFLFQVCQTCSSLFTVLFLYYRLCGVARQMMLPNLLLRHVLSHRVSSFLLFIFFISF